VNDLKKSLAIAGLLCVSAAIVATWIWWPRTAPPGKIPAVAPADPRAELPLDGYVLPSLSTADAQKVRDGQAVEFRVGEGSITIQNVKPAD